MAAGPFRGEPFPWDDTLSFVVGRLGLAPSAYWAMTPRELSVVLAPHVGGPAPLRAADLAALAARYPDRPPA